MITESIKIKKGLIDWMRKNRAATGVSMRVYAEIAIEEKIKRDQQEFKAKKK